MHPLQKQFHTQINKKQLFTKDEKILLAISGGVDSMAMAHLFLKGNFSFAIAHCNFGLRGAESEKDEELVRDWGKRHNVVCHVKHFRLEGSIQVAARNARYEWFEELRRVDKYDAVATAHHLNDSLETALFNLTRGTGIKGISGIASKSNGIIRPLLFAAKDQLIEFARDQGIPWREDASNAKEDYGRNLLRNKVIPVLKELNPSLDETSRNTIERLQLTNQVLEERIEDVKNGYLRKQGALWKLDIGWLKKGTDLLVLSEIVSDFGFNYVTAKEIYIGVGKSGKMFFSDGYELTIDRNSIYIKEKQRIQEHEVLISGEGEYQVGSYSFKALLITGNEFDYQSDSNVAFFDASAVQFPLRVTNWNKGDRFTPLGMEGSKKVSDYLIDRKVPVALKGGIKVVFSNEELIWLVGYQISDTCKVHDNTKTVLKLEIS